MAIDVSKLWNYIKPAESEQRFIEAMEGATPDDRLILQTQIARTHGLRKDFARAQQVLAAIAPQIGSASDEAQVRYWLELGRTHASPVHSKDLHTPEHREAARAANMRAFELAKAAKLDNLAIDALHMMVMVDTEPAAQLEWNLKAIAYMEASLQDGARLWEGSLYNNVGYALQQARRYEEALVYFGKSLATHEKAGRVSNVRIAHWMIASTYRAQGRLQEATDIQLRLEREWNAAGEPDPHVYEELEQLYRAQGQDDLARLYAGKLAAIRK